MEQQLYRVRSSIRFCDYYNARVTRLNGDKEQRVEKEGLLCSPTGYRVAIRKSTALIS